MTKISGVDLNDVNFLRDQIKYKFGSFKAFCNVTGIPYRSTLDAFNNLEFTKGGFKKINDAYRKKVNGDDVLMIISDEDREAIRVFIVTKFKTYTNFCIKHPDYDVVYLTNIIKGRLRRRTSKYIGLSKVLKEKYEVEIK